MSRKNKNAEQESGTENGQAVEEEIAEEENAAISAPEPVEATEGKTHRKASMVKDGPPFWRVRMENGTLLSECESRGAVYSIVRNVSVPLTIERVQRVRMVEPPESPLSPPTAQ